MTTLPTYPARLIYIKHMVGASRETNMYCGLKVTPWR